MEEACGAAWLRGGGRMLVRGFETYTACREEEGKIVICIP